MKDNNDIDNTWATANVQKCTLKTITVQELRSQLVSKERQIALLNRGFQLAQVTLEQANAQNELLKSQLAIKEQVIDTLQSRLSASKEDDWLTFGVDEQTTDKLFDVMLAEIARLRQLVVDKNIEINRLNR
jgi:hypothetical protein